jgi:uncharacterized protein YcbK (DUF882 family)
MKLSDNFSREEFACQCGCGFDTVDAQLLDVVQTLRDALEVPIKINSACRCNEHNTAVGGSANSQHTKGRACDVVATGVEPADVAEVVEFILDHKGIAGGVGRYTTFTHIDTRTNGPARWEG